jgi:hypothetical protein
MSETNLHLSQRPDPERVRMWREDIEHLRREITTLVMYRDDFAKFERVRAV